MNANERDNRKKTRLAPFAIGVALLVCFPGLSGEPQRPTPASANITRIIAVTLDGMGHQLFQQDPAAREMRTLRALARRGASGSAQPAFPSTTANSHAAVWTGFYGDVNGVVANDNPVLPRSEHTAFERRSGYRAESLLAEPLWVTAARQGLRAVAHHAPQAFPFLPVNTGPGAPVPPVVVNGYQTRQVARHTMITERDVSEQPVGNWEPALPANLPPRAFSWKAGPLLFHGAIVAEAGRDYDALYIAADPMGQRVRVTAAPLEDTRARGRDLARHFSDGLFLPEVGGGGPAVVYFRLFRLSADGARFELYQASVHELGLYDGSGREATVRERMLREAGGFVSNGPHFLYEDGKLGPQLYKGGDGTAERRYLEGVELVVRQFNRHSRWLWKEYEPRLLIDYLPFPDEFEHSWLGIARSPGTEDAVRRRMNEFRRRGYVLVDRRAEFLAGLAGPRDSIVFTADHGMTPAFKELRVNSVLREAGLLALDEAGRVLPGRTSAVHIRYGVLLNTTDWKDGIVAPHERSAFLDNVERALRAVRDPQTGAPVVTGFFRPETDGPKYGIGGPASADFYFDLAPGYLASSGTTGEAVRLLDPAAGTHGLRPDREDMRAVVVAAGPQFANRKPLGQMRSIEVAPLICDLLGIDPPRDARAKDAQQSTKSKGP